MKLFALIISLAVLSGAAISGEHELMTARGVGFALVVNEKCTGIPPDSNYQPALEKGLARGGISSSDFRSGFVSGAMIAEMQFPSKPPKKECAEAKALKAKIDKTFL